MPVSIARFCDTEPRFDRRRGAGSASRARMLWWCCVLACVAVSAATAVTPPDSTCAWSSLDGANVLVIGGTFVRANGEPAQNLAVWNGRSLAPLMSGVVGEVKALATAPDGGLVVGGQIGRAGDVVTFGVARRQGGAWSGLGSGVDQSKAMTLVRGLDEVEVDGVLRLVVGGQFESAASSASPATRRSSMSPRTPAAAGGSSARASRDQFAP
ncbi:MAG: hypothetical protein U0572_17605 [Phycisphaerales bacterium]